MSSAIPTNSFSGRRFRLLRTLGEGTFGAVYLAEMSSMGGFKKQVALKLLHSSWNPQSDAGRRLRDEARLLGRLNHRHIVRVDDLIRVQGRWALVMEYVAGVDLEAVIGVAREQGGRIPARVSVELGLAIADALHAAWTAEGDDGRRLAVVHRDIKPSNVLVAEGGDIKVLDFGVARAEFAGREARTERVRYGSMGYMSPERVLGGEEIPAGDVYALGVVLYELMTLQSFGRAELTPDAHAAKIVQTQEWLATLVDAPTLIALIGDCLAWEPAARPDADTLSLRLRDILRTMPGDDVSSFARTFVPIARERLAQEQAPPPDEEMREDIETNALPTGTGSSTGTMPPVSATIGIDIFPRRNLRAVSVAGAMLVLLGGGIAWLTLPTGLTGQTPATQGALPASPATPAPAPGPDLPLPAPTVVPAVAPATTAPTPAASAAPIPGRTPDSRTPATAAVTAATAVTPATAAATPAATPATAAATTAATPATPATGEAGPLLRSVKVTLTGGSGLQVQCGGVRGAGESSALLRDVPAGVCTVRVGGMSAQIEVREPRLVVCTVETGSTGERLSCR